MAENKIIEAEFTEVTEATEAPKAKANTTDLTIFTPKAIKPIEAEYLELSERYVTIRDEIIVLTDDAKEIEASEENLDKMNKNQRDINARWKEIDGARIQYKKNILALFVDPIEEKINKEVKIPLEDWENTSLAKKRNLENELLEKRVNATADWFAKTATEQGLDWLTLNDALNQKAVTVTRKNKSTDIVKAANTFIDKVKSDITVLRDGYGDEEIAEYRKTFNAATAIATVKARQAELDAAKQITVTPDAPLVQEVIPVSQAQKIDAVDGNIMTRVWELTGTREQLIALARTADDLGIEKKVLGGK